MAIDKVAWTAHDGDRYGSIYGNDKKLLGFVQLKEDGEGSKGVYYNFINGSWRVFRLGCSLEGLGEVFAEKAAERELIDLVAA